VSNRNLGVLGLFVIFLVALPCRAYAQYGGDSQSVYCASDDMRRHYCDIGRNSGVRLERQRSDARCIEGSTWGANRNQIWVDRGCRAEFTVFPERDWDRGRPGNGSDQVVSCSSDNMRRNYCNIGPNRGVRLIRQRSDARCEEGRSFGSSGNQMWVDRGCRGDFEVIGRGRPGWWGNGGNNGTSSVVYCASDDMRRNYCNVGPNRGIKLTRQRSDARCELNRTYGFDRDRIWVDRGCRADFEVMERR
jgi:hypothetical protein